MKPKRIMADPMQFLNAGITTTIEAATLTHIGRTGLIGATCPQIAEALGRHVSTVEYALNKLTDAGWLVRYSRQNGQGRAYRYAASVKGWTLLTTPPDLDMFEGALTKQAV